jgi:hypothetical protein
VGDVVLTGVGQGIVTDKIDNPVLEDAEQDVVVAAIPMGELLTGTKNHPVLLDGKWQLFGDVAGMEKIPMSWSNIVHTLEQKQRVINAWYDLEIDGSTQWPIIQTSQKEHERLWESPTWRCLWLES